MKDATPDKAPLTGSEKRYSDIFNTVAVAILEEDISEVRKAINDLKAEGITDFKRYFDENPDFVRRAAQTVKILCANNTAIKLYKAKDKSELLNSIDKIFTEKSYDVFKQELIAMVEGKKYFEAEDININFQGEPFDILVHTSLFLEYPAITTRLTSIIDITERKKAERRLSLQYEVVRILSESGDIPETMREILESICKDCMCDIGEIWFVDRETDTLRLCSVWHAPEWEGSEFVLMSKEFAFQEGIGLPGRVWESGKPVWITDVTVDEDFQRLQMAFKAGLHGAFAFPVIKSGRVVGVMVFIFRDIKSPDNDMLKMFEAIGIQIGGFIERRKAETELEKARKLESIGTLAGGIAHDFNNLLTAILGNIALAKMHMSQDNKDYSRLTEAENSCMKATELTGRLITFSKGGEPFRKALSIAGIINETICPDMKDTNISCECDIKGQLYHVYADEGQIKQVFRNMVINAKEAMPDGGVLRVSAENVTIDKDDAALKQGRYVKITIKDSGRGISEEILPKIFDPYFTTKGMGAEKGLGLGLAVCHSIIKKHGGHITVETKAGEGATFHICLPAIETEIKTTDKEDRPSISAKKKILFMDDEDYIRNIAVQILEHLGYDVEQTKDGSEAIKAYKEAKESGKAFDAVILDLTVHSGMGGDIAIERLISIDPEVKAIVSSGYADSPVLTDFKKYGFSGAISKPYNIEMLKDTLDRVLEGKKGDD